MSVEAAAVSHRHAFAGVPFTRLLGMRRNFSETGRAQLVIVLCQAVVLDNGAQVIARAIGSFRYLPHR